jgi:hypothetical protein
MIRKRDFFIKATLVCKENGSSFTTVRPTKTKKPSHCCEGFLLLAPPLELPDFTSLHRDKLLALRGK